MTATATPLAPTPAEAAIRVAGNVGGSVVSGNRNLVVSTNNGTIVQELINPSRQRRPVARAPRPPDPFVARGAELGRLGAVISARRAVTVSGPSGAGRTALMHAAASQGGAGLPDGVLRVDGIDAAGRALTLDDLAQRLHDSAWDCVPTAKVDAGSARTQLGGIQALAMIDDVGLPGGDLERLADLLPDGAALIATSRPIMDSALDDVGVGSLPRPDAITLLTARAGIQAQPADAAELDAMCALLADWPEAMVIAGRAIAVRGLAPAAARAELEAVRPRSPEPSAAAIERAYALAYPALDGDARSLLVTASRLPGSTHDPDILRRIAGNPDWFDAAAAQLQALGLLNLNSPRFRVPDGVRTLAAEEAGIAPAGIEDRYIAAMSEVALRHILDAVFAPAELGDLLGAFDGAVRSGRFVDAVVLGRAIAPGIVLAGLWDAWRQVAEGVRAAAEQVGRERDLAWATHELGTRALGLGRDAEARELLTLALDQRRRMGDVEGAAHTLHNLRWLGAVIGGGGGGGGPTPNGSPRPWWWLGLGGAIVAVAIFVFLFARPFEPTPTPTPSAPPSAEPTEEPSQPPSEPPAEPLAIFPEDGPYDVNDQQWTGALTVRVEGGNPPYTVILDDGRQSSDNPATFTISGTPCLPITVGGEAVSSDGQKLGFEHEMVPDPCVTPPPFDVACVTFDDQEPGTVWGEKGGQAPGEPVLQTPEGIVVAVDRFYYSTEGDTFGDALIQDASPDIGDGQIVWTNNINLVFDFSQLPIAVAGVDFNFRQYGGNQNLGVNGSDIYRDLLTDMPSPIGDVEWRWQDQDNGSMTGFLLGPVEQLKIGGQEFALDTVCAHR